MIANSEMRDPEVTADLLVGAAFDNQWQDLGQPARRLSVRGLAAIGMFRSDHVERCPGHAGYDRLKDRAVFSINHEDKGHPFRQAFSPCTAVASCRGARVSGHGNPNRSGIPVQVVLVAGMRTPDREKAEDR